MKSEFIVGWRAERHRLDDEDKARLPPTLWDYVIEVPDGVIQLTILDLSGSYEWDACQMEIEDEPDVGEQFMAALVEAVKAATAGEVSVAGGVAVVESDWYTDTGYWGAGGLTELVGLTLVRIVSETDLAAILKGEAGK